MAVSNALRVWALIWLGAALASPTGCDRATTEATGAGPSQQEAALSEDGEPVTPPFEVKAELEGLLLVWFDEEGQHTAKTRSEIPEAQREHVRVDSLAIDPSKRLDADHVYIADVRKPRADGSYPVRKHTRAFLDAVVTKLRPAPPPASESDVTVYMASWCGACRAAASYLRSKNVPFVEKDIEKDPTAAAEMQAKARAAGKSPRGVPVIDFKGTILLGYDQGALATLIAADPG
jgi:glutaredoxin